MNEVVSRKSLTLLMLALLLLSATGVPAFSDPLAVYTDEEVYRPGEAVTIYGSANASGVVYIQVNVSSQMIFNITTIAAENGSYTVTLQLSTNATPGEYVVIASSGEESDEAEFQVEESVEIEPQVEDGACDLADSLLSLLEASHAQAEAVLDRVEEEGVKVSEAAEKLELGEEAAEEAIRLREEGDCQSAAARATEALRLYGEAIQMALEAEPEGFEEDKVEEEAEEAIRLRVAIQRAYSFLDKVNDTATQLEQRGFNVSDVKALLEEARGYLELAETMLGIGDVEGAEDRLAIARETLGQAMGLLRSKNKESKIEKASRFLEKTEERLQRLEERITNILGGLPVSPAAIAAVSDAFQDAQQRIQEIRELIARGDIDSAIDEFDEVFEDADEGLEILGEFNSKRTDVLKDLGKIEAKIDYLEDETRDLRDEGVDVSYADATLLEARGLMDEALSNLEEDEVETAEDLLDHAEDLVKEVEHMVEDLEEEAEELHEETEELLEEIGELEDEIAELEEKIEGLADKDVDVSDLEARLQEARELLEEARAQADDVENAENLIDEAEDILDEVEDLIEDLEEDEEETEEEIEEVEEEEIEEGVEEEETEEEED